MKLYKRSRILWSIIALGSIFQMVHLTFVGCSHTTPYYHHDLPVSAKQDVASESSLRYRILLIGDGGQPKPDEPVLKTLKTWAQKDPEKTSIIFLGDNMYPDGMIEERLHEASTRLDPQIEVVTSTTAHGLFIPGNHDWTNGDAEGYQAILSQEDYINKALTRTPKFLPQGGTPGPTVLDLPDISPVVRVIVLDTQWWLHQNEKPQKAIESIISELKDTLDTDFPVVVVGHHPLQTYGTHGGFFSWKAHLFPLRELEKWLWVPVPIVGSLYPLSRWYFIRNVQDLNNAKYKEMVSQLNATFTASKRTHLLIYASGHEHSLQVLKGETTDYLLISGLGSSEKATEVGHGVNTLFAHQHSGFMSIDFLSDKRVLLRVVEPNEKEVLFHHWLK